MSYALPVAGSPVRELFDVADVVKIGTGEEAVPTFRNALASCKRLAAGNKAVKSVVSFAVRANDDLVLIQVGARGGWRQLWNFGPIGRNGRLA